MRPRSRVRLRSAIDELQRSLIDPDDHIVCDRLTGVQPEEPSDRSSQRVPLASHKAQEPPKKARS